MDTVKLLKIARTYAGIVERCYSPKSAKYKDYGARGIEVCDEWLSDPGAFFKWCDEAGDITGLACDRRDNDKGYSPENCRWVTAMENNRNRRNTVRLTAFGESKTLVEWTEDARAASGLVWQTLRYRIERGWAAERAITEALRPNAGTGIPIMLTAFGETKSQAAWVKDPRCQITKNTLGRRIRDDWPHELAITTPSRTLKKRPS